MVLLFIPLSLKTLEKLNFFLPRKIIRSKVSKVVSRSISQKSLKFENEMF